MANRIYCETLHQLERNAGPSAVLRRVHEFVRDRLAIDTFTSPWRLFVSQCADGVRYAGFAGLENGELLKQAEAAKFDVLLTVDRGFEYQQNLADRQIAPCCRRAWGLRRCPCVRSTRTSSTDR
jgi:hypothetical protein